MLIIFNREDGALSKADFIEGAGNIQSSWTISEVKINPGLNGDRFSFTPPAGVEVKDGTASMIESLLQDK